MTAAVFDTHAHIKKLTAAGVSEQQAGVHAEVLLVTGRIVAAVWLL